MNNLLRGEALIRRARQVRGVIFDCDGVLTTGHEFIFEIRPGEVTYLKQRFHADGQGISLLRAAGIFVCVVTGENGPRARFAELLVRDWNDFLAAREGILTQVGLFSGSLRRRKVEDVETWLRKCHLAWSECAYMGDDIGDLDAIEKIVVSKGFAAAPSQAEGIIKRRAHWITPRAGGAGAVRDLCNLILAAKKIDPVALSTH